MLMSLLFFTLTLNVSIVRLDLSSSQVYQFNTVSSVIYPLAPMYSASVDAVKRRKVSCKVINQRDSTTLAVTES